MYIGSGKTAAFLCPVIYRMVKFAPKYGESEDSYYSACPRGLFLAPTRELAIQIADEAKRFTYRSHLKTVVVYGGARYPAQLSQLQLGCDLLVATPGRLLDFIQRGVLSLRHIEYLCLDEADRMLDMGFEQQVINYLFEMLKVPFIYYFK